VNALSDWVQWAFGIGNDFLSKPDTTVHREVFMHWKDPFQSSQMIGARVRIECPLIPIIEIRVGAQQDR
jgi:hypothetical protein